MAARLADSHPPIERLEFIKCQTEWCRHNLGVRMAGGRVYWNVPALDDFQAGTSEIECPCCHVKRVWTHRKPRSR